MTPFREDQKTFTERDICTKLVTPALVADARDALRDELAKALESAR